MKQWISAISGIVVLAGQSMAGPQVINDTKLLDTMSQGLGAMVDAKQSTDGETLAKASKKAPLSAEVKLPANLTPTTRYDDLAKSIFIIGSAGKCGHCTKWHIGNTATAWCLTSDGLMVTNHHVFARASGAAWGICGIDGKVYRVLDVIATDPVADVALFRVDAKGLIPLPLGADSEVGDKVSIISHPDRRCYFRTSGEVARYLSAVAPGNKACTWMSVTADFAKGSSGGPVFNPLGEVVGMVSSTQSIYYGPPRTDKPGKDTKEKAGHKEPVDQGPLQMVIKNCVPVAALRAIIKAPAAAADDPRAK